MTNRINEKKVKFIINFVYTLLIAGTAYISIKYLFWLVFPFIIAFLLSYIAEPTVYVLSKELKIKRSFCASICIFVILILLFCFILFLSVTLYSQIKELFGTLPGIWDTVIEFINDTKAKSTNSIFEKVFVAAYDFIQSLDISFFSESGMLGNVVGYFTSIVKSLPQLFMSAVITFVFSVFVSSSFPSIKEFIKKQLSSKNLTLVKEIKNSSCNILKNYFKSYTVLMLITFTELSLAFTVFKIRPAFALALIISLIDILPVFGVGTVMIPWGIICFILGDFSQGTIVFSIYAVITVVRQIIEPKIIGDGLGLPPIVTLPAMFLGLKLFGIPGLFISPMIVTLIYDLNSKGFISIWK